ncbi:MAG: hypothetical protein V9E81_17175 [Marmoricola sp.]
MIFTPCTGAGSWDCACSDETTSQTTWLPATAAPVLPKSAAPSPTPSMVIVRF